MKRPDQHQYFMDIAKATATRSNCYRRQVGCVLVDANNRILSTGYNGVPRGFPHCKKGECPRENPGENLDKCYAAHAEMNALIQCRDIDQVYTIYVTDSPCLPCTIVLLNTNCFRIIFDKEYPGAETSKIAWLKLNRQWIPYESTRDR